MLRPYLACLPGLILFFVLNACKKTGHDEPAPPVALPDSALSVTHIDLPDFKHADIDIEIRPAAGVTLDKVILQWSLDPAFVQGSDSTLIARQQDISLQRKISLADLQPGSTYYVRLKATVRDQFYFSEVSQFMLDDLRILSYFGLDTFPLTLNRAFDQNSTLLTNLPGHQPLPGELAKVLLGNYDCPIVEDGAIFIRFHVPEDIPTGWYGLTLKKDGYMTKSPDSIFILPGLWKQISAPDLIGSPSHNGFNALQLYGTCQSATKGYLIPGTRFYGVADAGTTDSDYWRPSYLMEFDPATENWTKKKTVNPHYFEDPRCFYHNNGVYVIGGLETTLYDGNPHLVRNMYRLDVSSLTWSDLGTMPMPATYNQVSFEVNNEWYIGLGQDSANRDLCCGVPIPSKKIWKYNPATAVWSTIADFPGTKFQAKPTGFELNGKAYIFFGALLPGYYGDLNGTEFDEELWEYDPLGNAWTQIDLPAGLIPEGEKYSIVTYNDRIYFISGQKREFFGYYYGMDLKNPCISFDPVTKAFERFSDANQAGVMKKIFQVGNQIYFLADVFGYYEANSGKAMKLVIE